MRRAWPGGGLLVLRADRSAPPSGVHSDFPTRMRACAALANRVRLRRLEEGKREELRRTPFAILDKPPAELRPTKGGK